MADDESFKLLIENNKIYSLKEKKPDISELEEKYHQYVVRLNEHIESLADAWIYQLAPFAIDFLDDEEMEAVDDLISQHDVTKLNIIDNSWITTGVPRCYLDGFDKTDSDDILTFITHVHENPHHWEYYVVTCGGTTNCVTEIPKPFIMEMLCDWHSYSRINPTKTAYNYWINNKDRIIMAPETREIVDYYSQILQIPLESSEYYRILDNDEDAIDVYLENYIDRVAMLNQKNQGKNGSRFRKRSKRF